VTLNLLPTVTLAVKRLMVCRKSALLVGEEENWDALMPSRFYKNKTKTISTVVIIKISLY
jgi:hypothetical protein